MHRKVHLQCILQEMKHPSGGLELKLMPLIFLNDNENLYQTSLTTRLVETLDFWSSSSGIDQVVASVFNRKSNNSQYLL